MERKVKGTAQISKELLSVTGNGSTKDIVELLMKKNVPKIENLKTCKVGRSHLFEQLEQFLPQMEKSTMELMDKSEEEKESLNIENVDGCSQVVEMNLLLGCMAENSDEESSWSNSDSSSYSSDSSSDNEGCDIRPLSSVNKESYKKHTHPNKRKKCKKLITEVDTKTENNLSVNPSPEKNGNMKCETNNTTHSISLPDPARNISSPNLAYSNSSPDHARSISSPDVER